MPKQSGIYQIKGKFENRSYYHPKNMSTGVFRSINPTMSERVKKDANFENTRCNAAEFGCATSWSGQTIGYLHELATMTNLAKKRGDITTTALGFIRNDELHPFGQRTITTDGWEELMMGKFNQLPRLSFDENFTTGIKFTRRPITTTAQTQYKLHINIPSFRESAASLAQWGARYVDYAVYLCRWECGYYSTLLGKYYHSQLVTTEAAHFASYNSGIDADILTDDVLREKRPRGWFVKALVVCTPIAEVNDTEYPLLHLRSFKFFDIPWGGVYLDNVEYMGNTYKNGDAAFELDLSYAPTMIANMHLDEGSLRPTPVVKINGINCDKTHLGEGKYQITMPPALDGDLVRVISLTFGSTIYTLRTI